MNQRPLFIFLSVLILLSEGCGKSVTGLRKPAAHHQQPQTYDTGSSRPEPADADAGLVQGNVYPGFTLFSPMGSRHTYLVDNSGTVIHSWTSRYPTASAVYLTRRGTILRAERTAVGPGRGGGSGGLLSEYDFQGRLVWQFRMDAGTRVLHHDFMELENGNIMALSWENRQVSGQWYQDERIIEIHRASKAVVWEWRALDHVSPRGRHRDNFHFNSIDVKGDRILISARSRNEIWMIDQSSGDITFRYGRGLTGQHDATFLPNGHILVFDNGRGSSAVKEIDPVTRTLVWQTSNRFYSSHISGTQRLENGNTFICVGESGRFIEVDSAGRVVWTYQNPFSREMGRGPQMASVFNARKYSSALAVFLDNLSG